MKLSAAVAVVVLGGLSLSPVTKAAVYTGTPSYLIIGNYQYTCQHACSIAVVSGITVVTDSGGGSVYMDPIPPPPPPPDSHTRQK